MSSDSLPLYAVIDLGSNSFHMLLLHRDQNKVQIFDKIKRKVRLAEGLDQHSWLDDNAIERGLSCLALFAQHLAKVRPDRIKIVATAALRQAKNAQDFIARGEALLGHPINIISGEQEAALIYQGAASGFAHLASTRYLVVDIGGASTELIIGTQHNPLLLKSLNMGCVTWLEQYFQANTLSSEQFEAAIAAAKKELMPIVSAYQAEGWQIALGASGTLQSLHKIALAQGDDSAITRDFLYQQQEKVLRCKQQDKLCIAGLSADRAKVFPSGLAILIAIFESLNIESMALAQGALREGLIAQLISES